MAARAVEPLRVLLVTDSLAVGGAERHVVNLAAALCRDGHRVHIAASAAGPLVDAACEAGAQVSWLGDYAVKRRADDEYTTWVRRVAMSLRPDLVHAHMHASALAAAGVSAEVNAPFVVTEHSEATWRDADAWGDAARVYGQAQAIIAVSDRIARRLALMTGVGVERIHVIRNALPLPVPSQRPNLRRSRSRRLVGVISRLVPEKGVDVFIEAAARIHAAKPHAHFVVVGDGPERAALEALATRRGIRSNIGFLGARADAASILQRLDVLCVPSRSEGTPLVVLESMATGTPIVATDVGGIPEQVRHERDALLVRPDDARALADATLRVMRHRMLARRLTYSARWRADHEFSPERMVGSVESVYRQCLEPDAELTVAPVAVPIPATA